MFKTNIEKKKSTRQMQTQGNWRTDQRQQINKNHWLVQQKMNRFSQGLGQLSKFSQENWQTY